MATITGVAPKAWLGNYKVFGTPGVNDGATDDAILKAMDDAVSDGMDIINLSLGDDIAPRLADDLDVQAVERATQAGVIVVAAAGNNGPSLNTISSPATATSAIAVGASTNDRTFAESVEVPGLASYLALTGDARATVSQLTASLVDVASMDGGGLACAAFSDCCAARTAMTASAAVVATSRFVNSRLALACWACDAAALTLAPRNPKSKISQENRTPPALPQRLSA
jgi:hypothetical protein